MCSKVLNGHIILTDTSITTILAPEMTYTPIKTFVIALFFRNFTYFCPKVMIFRRVKRIPEVSLRGAESEKNDL